MTAIGYIRRSKRSTEKNVSLEVQSQAIAEYAQAHAFMLSELVRHDGVSGTKRSRFEEIEEAIGREWPDALLIYNLDRLARDCAGLKEYLASLTARGIEVHEVKSGRLDSTTALGGLMVTVRGAMDEFYTDMVSEKTIDALGRLKSQGRQYTNIPPFGFRYDARLLVEDIEEQKAIVTLIEARAKGFGARLAIRYLRQSGYAGRISPSTVKKVWHEQKKLRSITLAD